MTIRNSTTESNHYNSSAPAFADLQQDEPDIVASPLYNDPSFKAELVTIPSSNVFLDENNTPYTSSVSNYSHTDNYPNRYGLSSTSTAQVISPVNVTSAPPTTGGRRQCHHHHHNNGRRNRRVSPKNAHLPPQVLDFKERRKNRTVASAWAGGAIGLFTVGPLGAVVGAYGGYAAAKSVGKARERKLIKQCVQQGVQSPVAIATPVTSDRGVMS